MRQDLLPTTRVGKVVHLIEELGEVTKAAGKLLRFGATATDPKTGIKYDNVVDLLDELQDLQHAIDAVQRSLKA